MPNESGGWPIFARFLRKGGQNKMWAPNAASQTSAKRYAPEPVTDLLPTFGVGDVDQVAWAKKVLKSSRRARHYLCYLAVT